MILPANQASSASGPLPLLIQRREESELLEGEVTAHDEAGGVLVHPHGDERAGMAEPLGDGRDGHVLDR
jgi:hypothetical protein